MSSSISICICGAGTMGEGIALASMQNGLPTLLYDVEESRVDRAKANISAMLREQSDKKRLTASQLADAMDCLHVTLDISQCQAPFILEAISEDVEAKTKLYDQLEEVNSSQTVIATNTSSLSVTTLSQQLRIPTRFLGMHFFNPAHLMRLVEIVKTELTDLPTLNQTMKLAERLGKTTVVCADKPGFIVNRVARPYYLEALYMAQQGIANFDQIDLLMESSGFKMGPFRLMDLIGNDINYAVSNKLYHSLGEPSRLKPSSLQYQKVQAGDLGKKAGRGFYSYTGGDGSAKG